MCEYKSLAITGYLNVPAEQEERAKEIIEEVLFHLPFDIMIEFNEY